MRQLVRQKALIKKVASGLSLFEAADDLDISREALAGWLSDETFAGRLKAIEELNIAAGRLAASSCAVDAAMRLALLSEEKKLDVGRKACLDILSGSFLPKPPTIILQGTDALRSMGVEQLAKACQCVAEKHRGLIASSEEPEAYEE